MHKRINTTVQKAKELRKFVDPLVTRSKENTTHNRRMTFAALRQKEIVTELFTVVGPKVGDRPGGYTRIIKTGTRLGDNAEMCMIELVDFNEIYSKNEKKKTRRSRRGGASTVSKTESAPAADVAADVPADVAADAPADDAADVAADGDGLSQSGSERDLRAGYVVHSAFHALCDDEPRRGAAAAVGIFGDDGADGGLGLSGGARGRQGFSHWHPDDG